MDIAQQAQRIFRRFYNVDMTDKSKAYLVTCQRTNALGERCDGEYFSPTYCCEPVDEREQEWWDNKQRTYEMLCDDCGRMSYVAFDINSLGVNTFDIMPYDENEFKGSSTQKLEENYGIKIK